MLPELVEFPVFEPQLLAPVAPLDVTKVPRPNRIRHQVLVRAAHGGDLTVRRAFPGGAVFDHRPETFAIEVLRRGVAAMPEAHTVFRKFRRFILSPFLALAVESDDTSRASP